MDCSSDDPRLSKYLSSLEQDSSISTVELTNECLEVPWFPLVLKDVDTYGVNLLQVQDTVNQDHVSFKDPIYRQRRDYIANLNINTNINDPIQKANYTKQENNLW